MVDAPSSLPAYNEPLLLLDIKDPNSIPSGNPDLFFFLSSFTTNIYYI